MSKCDERFLQKIILGAAALCLGARALAWALWS